MDSRRRFPNASHRAGRRGRGHAGLWQRWWVRSQAALEMGRRLVGNRARARRLPIPNRHRAVGSSNRVEQRRCPSTGMMHGGRYRPAAVGAEPGRSWSRKHEMTRSHVQWSIAAAMLAVWAPRAAAQTASDDRRRRRRQPPGRPQSGPARPDCPASGRRDLRRQLRAAAEDRHRLHHRPHVDPRRAAARADQRASSCRTSRCSRPCARSTPSRRLRTAPGAHHWRLLGLQFTTTGAGDVIALGDGVQRDRALVPTDLILDRIMIRGDPTTRTEARHRAQQRQHVRPEQLHRRHPRWPARRRRGSPAGTGRAPS